MRRVACTLFSCVMLASLAALGCGGKPATVEINPSEPTKTPEEVLVGTWEGAVEIDSEVVNKKLDAVKDEDEPTKNRVYWSIETPASLKSKLNLKPDGSMTMAATINTADGDKTIEGQGKWSVISAEGDQAKVRLDYEGQVEEKVFTFEDADAFATDPPGVDKTIGTLKFKRLR